MPTAADNKHPDQRTGSWLDSLQQESWQLELLISGFSIFLLLAGWSKLVDLETDLVLLGQTSQNFSALESLYYISRMALGCLLATLVFHVLLRGMWIAAIGLRSVSGDIDYDALRPRPRFRNFLERRIGSFDGYIARLERNCSVSFTVALLIFFGLLSFAILIFLLNVIAFILVAFLGEDAWDPVNNIVLVIMLIFGVPYLLDFVTIGWLKRQKWCARPYYYIYRIMGWVTLARFSRPLYYNLIDNRFGRRLAIGLPVLMLAAVLFSSYEHITHAYYPAYSQQGREIILSGAYDDEGHDTNSRLWRPSLASRYVENNYLQVFIPYLPVNHDEDLQFHYPDLVPARLTGSILRGGLHIGESATNEADNTELREAMSSLWRLSVDSIRLDVSPRFYKHEQRRQLGLLYMIPTHDLAVGEHELMIQKRMHLRDTLRFETGNITYFYK